MPIRVNMADPPPYVVLVQFPDTKEAKGEECVVTWPFPTHEAATAAYALALGSGQFTRVLKKATTTRPAFTVDLVSCWKAKYEEGVDGKQHLTYVGCPPWVPAPEE